MSQRNVERRHIFDLSEGQRDGQNGLGAHLPVNVALFTLTVTLTLGLNSPLGVRGQFKTVFRRCVLSFRAQTRVCTIFCKVMSSSTWSESAESALEIMVEIFRTTQLNISPSPCPHPPLPSPMHLQTNVSAFLIIAHT